MELIMITICYLIFCSAVDSSLDGEWANLLAGLSQVLDVN